MRSNVALMDVALLHRNTHCFVNLLAIGQSYSSVEDNNLLSPHPGRQLFNFHLSDSPSAGQVMNTKGHNAPTGILMRFFGIPLVSKS